MINQAFRLLKFSVNSATENMAIDEAIFRFYDELKQDTIRFYSWKPSAVSIGKHQNINDEVNMDNLKKLGFDCVRRISGGGAVFHDEFGELTYSIVTNSRFLTSKILETSYYELSQLVFHPLTKMGLNFNYNKTHCPSVFSEGKKISFNSVTNHTDICMMSIVIIVKKPTLIH